jgi:hypothetical protein
MMMSKNFEFGWDVVRYIGRFEWETFFRRGCSDLLLLVILILDSGEVSSCFFFFDEFSTVVIFADTIDPMGFTVTKLWVSA